MSRSAKAALLSLCVLLSFVGRASEVTTKVIEIEWEPITRAGGYDLKFIPDDGKAAIFVRTTESRLSQELPIGKYRLQIRTRAKDEDYASDWSAPVPIEVVEKTINPLKPEDKAVIESKATKHTVEFEWSPVENVKEYTLKVWNDKRKDNPWVFVTRQTRKRLEVPAAENYYWQVLFEAANSINYQQEPTTLTFTLLGSRLVTPSISTPKSITDVRGLTWTESPGAEEYVIELAYRHLDETEFQPIKSLTTKDLKLPFDQLKPGVYRAQIQARAIKRLPSEKGQLEFLVKPTAEAMRAALAQGSQPADSNLPKAR